jgi:hypothetical protein
VEAVRARLRAWLEPKVRGQRARVVAATAVVADVDPVAEIDQMCADIITAHNERYHPGYGCAENIRAQCLDAFGGERAPGVLGDYVRLPDVDR